jgi:pimeloyl-ACP methyl ester carboxylesterase
MQLNAEPKFHEELLHWMSQIPYRGGDVGELLDVAGRIRAGDAESWLDEFVELAERVGSETPSDRRGRRDQHFRAASYYRAADFFTKSNPADPRIDSLWAAALRHFDEAIALMEPPGERVAIDAESFQVPAVVYRAASGDEPRPALLMFNGFDGSQEEMLHVSGLAALERGFNVVTFEGPGQPTVVRRQREHFRPDWERVVSPVVDFVSRLPFIDPGRLGLLGLSFGGYLAPRAAAFEPRLRAVAAIDGFFDVFEGFMQNLPAAIRQSFDEGNVEAFNRRFNEFADTSLGLRWYRDQGMWAFGEGTPFAFVDALKRYSLRGVAQSIRCPLLVGEGADDAFFKGQAEQLTRAVGKNATLRRFTSEHSAGGHARAGAYVYGNSVVLDWFAAQFGTAP